MKRFDHRLDAVIIAVYTEARWDLLSSESWATTMEALLTSSPAPFSNGWVRVRLTVEAVDWVARLGDSRSLVPLLVQAKVKAVPNGVA